MTTNTHPSAVATTQPQYFVVGNLPPTSWHPPYTALTVEDAADWQAGSSAVLIIALAAQQQDELLTLLRGQPSTSLMPIFVEQNSPLAPYLANGVFEQSHEQHVRDMFSRRLHIRLRYEEDPAFKLLAWLWVTQQPLIPFSKPSTNSLFEHPLLTIWQVPVADSFTWLSRLRKKGWLESAGLHNRIRLCNTCSSGHLNYIDVCPSCQDIDIELRASLHCFSCGHVGNQDSFRKAPGLSCPNCLITLRHIGVDYDRPIENQYCNHCQSLFTDAEVEAQCLDCDARSGVDQLRVRNLHRYALSPSGRRIVRQGFSADHMKLQIGESLTNQQFYWLIDWQNQLARRHKHIHSIAYIEILELNNFLRSEGETGGLALLDALQERLAGLVRVTDACSNTLADGLLIFLPYTSEAEVNIIFKKLSQLTTEQTRTPLHLRLRTVSLPDNIGAKVEDWLTEKLATAAPYQL